MTSPQFNPTIRNSSGKSSGIGAVVFLILFATPFAGCGLVALFQGVKKTIAGETENGLMLSLFGLIFSTVGFGLMFEAVWGRKKLQQADELQSRFADKPWQARADWAAGKIKPAATAPVKFFLLWSFLALALSTPGVLAIPKEWQKGNHGILFVLIFPAVAFYLLGYSFVKWRSRKRFGECFFEPAQIPIPPGSVLEGMIQTGKPLKLEHELSLTFSCIRRVVSNSGKERQVNEYPLWQAEKIYSGQASLPQMEDGQTGIPIHFKLPADQPESYSRGSDSVFWRLVAKSKMRGPDFSVAFDVPVFNVAGAIAENADEPDPTVALQAPIEEIQREENSRIKVSDGPNGREFYFPAARNIGSAIMVTLFTFLFIGIAAGTYHSHAPVLFPIVFGIIGGLMIFGVVSAWFKSSRVTINSTNVRATNRWLVFSRTRQFSAGDVSQFVTKIGMQSGTQIFTDIKLIPRGGEEKYAADEETFRKTFQDADVPGVKKVVSRFREATSPSGVTVASSIASVAEANWLVQEMNKALGRK
jgi:hypothetical protein